MKQQKYIDKIAKLRKLVDEIKKSSFQESLGQFQPTLAQSMPG